MTAVTARPEVDETPDAAPDLRWVLADERTLLARFRLSLALFLLGLVPLSLVPPGVATVLVCTGAAALMVASAAVAVVGVRRWWGAQQAE